MLPDPICIYSLIYLPCSCHLILAAISKLLIFHWSEELSGQGHGAGSRPRRTSPGQRPSTPLFREPAQEVVAAPGIHPEEGREREEGAAGGQRGCGCLGLEVAWAAGVPCGLGGGAVSPREQAGFGGSRLCLHLPRTPSPRSPLIPGASPTPGLSAQSAHLQLLLQKVTSLSLELPTEGSWDPGAPSLAH